MRFFIESFAHPFALFESEIRGRLRVRVTDDVKAIMTDYSPSISDELIKWYRCIANYTGFDNQNFPDNLKIENVAPVITPSIKAKNFSILGSIQLAECIGRICQVIYIIENSFIYVHSDKDKKERNDYLLNVLLNSDNPENYERYLLPNSIVINTMNEKGNTFKFTTIFACWMALFSPISPNTIHLAKEYRLAWEDLHPGSRFLKIVCAIKKLKLKLETSVHEMRHGANEYHDKIAEKLRWPSFNEMKSSMSNLASKSKRKIFSSDPFFDIYSRVNLNRTKVPWCDIFPGEELRKGANPVQIPLVIEPGGIVPCGGDFGNRGLREFALTRLVNFIVFGQTNELLNIFFNIQDDDLDNLANTVLPGIDIEWLKSQYKQQLSV